MNSTFSRRSICAAPPADEASTTRSARAARDPAHAAPRSRAMRRRDALGACRACRARSRTPTRPGLRRRPGRRDLVGSPARSARDASRAGTPLRRWRSACRRSSSPARAVRCRCCSRCTRGSSRCRPSSILRGRNGSEIVGRAEPMMSSGPSRMTATIVSGLVKRPDADDRLVGVRTGRASTQRSDSVLLEEARRPCVLAPLGHGRSADLQVPEVDEVIGCLDERGGLDLGTDALARSVQRVDAEAGRDRAVVADRRRERARASRARSVPGSRTEPPYSSVRLLNSGIRKSCGMQAAWEPMMLTMSNPARPGALRRRHVELLELTDVLRGHRVARREERFARDLRRAARGEPRSRSSSRSVR